MSTAQKDFQALAAQFESQFKMTMSMLNCQVQTAEKGMKEMKKILNVEFSTTMSKPSILLNNYKRA